MPFYEYQCPQCGFEKEILHGINAKPEITCEACNGANLQRLISAAGFRLKGGGWYETDFKGDGSKRNIAGDAKADSSGDGAGKAKTETSGGGDAAASKSDSKPAAKQASGSGNGGGSSGGSSTGSSKASTD